ncbi:WXG100 family type VII secretion target [Gordonia sp. DT218]|uniref:WXG100 family type VII secretion target n=1 Tax=Gordonia sp. DT218 TaxID=3416659 RepID=UPI003CFAD2D8
MIAQQWHAAAVRLQGDLMGEHVNVDPADLRYGAHQLGGWHDDTAEIFDSGHRRVGEASAGWVGASAAALTERLDALRASAEAVTTRLGDHSTKFALSAHKFESQDESSGEAISQVIPAGSSGHLTL